MIPEVWPLDRLQPYSGNPRTITNAAVDKVVASLVEYGWAGQYCVADKSDITIIGHTRHRAARQIAKRGLEVPGWTDINTMPVIVRAELTEDQVRALRLMDNRSHEETAWNDQLLAVELGAIEDINLELTGFAIPEIDDLIKAAMGPVRSTMTVTQETVSENEINEEPVAEPSTKTEPPEQQLYDTQATIGEYRFALAREEYTDWLEGIRQESGFSKSEVITEIKRRLGLPS